MMDKNDPQARKPLISYIILAVMVILLLQSLPSEELATILAL